MTPPVPSPRPPLPAPPPSPVGAPPRCPPRARPRAAIAAAQSLPLPLPLPAGGTRAMAAWDALDASLVLKAALVLGYLAVRARHVCGPAAICAWSSPSVACDSLSERQG